MKKAVKTIIRPLAVAVMGVASICSTQAYAPLGSTYASGDAVVGFTTGSGNELIANLGLLTSITNGEQWNLSTLLGDAGLTSVNNIQFGVIAISGGKYYATAVHSSDVPNASAANYLKSMFVSNPSYPINSSGYSIDPASDSLSWYNNVATPTTGGLGQTPYQLLAGSADITTPATGSFTFAQDSATWEVSGSTGGPTTNFWAFNSNGILMYSNTVVSSVVAPRIVAVTRNSTTSTVYFTTSNSGTYALYYTASLAAPVQWTALPTTLTGNGLTNNLSDTTASADRFYRVGAH